VGRREGGESGTRKTDRNDDGGGAEVKRLKCQQCGEGQKTSKEARHGGEKSGKLNQI